MRTNAMASFARQMLGKLGSTFNGDRDLYDVFGYKKDISGEDYRFRYERGDIAARIVDAYPNACWSSPPEPTDDQDTQDETEWERSFKDEAKRLKLWSVVRRADILAQLNDFSIIVIGTSGDTEKEATGRNKILYLKPFGSDCIKVNKWVSQSTNKRFGLPETYKIELAADVNSGAITELIVHHSRVIHIAERTLDNPTKGTPFLKPVWNRLDDLEKVAGSSAEIWWLNGRGGLDISVNDDFQLEDEDKESITEQVEAYQNGMNRTIRTQGVTIKAIDMKIQSPKDHADLPLTLIAGTTGIPKRILTGSERGELSSSQDENNFNSRIKERRAFFCEPEILEPLIEKLIELGSIAKAEFEWNWPNLNTLSEKDAATIGKDKAAAIATYSNAPAAESLIPPEQFVVDVLGLDFKQAEIKQLLEDENEEIDNSLLDDQ
jgi:hypothetical protein